MQNVLRITPAGEIHMHRSYETISRKRIKELVGDCIDIVKPVGLIPPFVMVTDPYGISSKPINKVACRLCSSNTIISGDIVIMAEDMDKLMGLTDDQTETMWRYITDILGDRKSTLGTAIPKGASENLYTPIIGEK